MTRNHNLDFMLNGERVPPVMAISVLTNGGNIAVQTAANGADFVQLPGFECFQVTIAAPKGVDIEVNQFGAGDAFPVFGGTTFTFRGIPNSNWLRLRRVDLSATQISVSARWEG